MKTLLFGLLIFVLNLAHAGERIESYMHFVVVHDTIDSSLNGQCRITGRVFKSASDSPLFRAKIELSNGENRQSDSLGNFYYQLLNPGTYTLKAVAADYSETKSHEIELKANQKIVVEFHLLGIMECVTKPVIYLYADDNTELDLSLNFKGNLAFTYPKYDNGWHVEVKEGGKLLVDGDVFNYLFWDGELERSALRPYDNYETGSVVTAENMLEFLESNLTSMGMNSFEKQDFITYWMPQLMEYDNCYVRFYVNEEYSAEIAEIKSSVKIDHHLRVYMIAEPVDDSIIINPKSQSFTILKREGLTLVEWGGSLLKPVLRAD